MKKLFTWILSKIGISSKAAIIAGTIIAQNEKGKNILLYTRDLRIKASEGSRKRGPTYYTVKTLLEMIPFGLGPYGIGDAISLSEALGGKEIRGRKLDLVDRIISLIAALIPIMPATPLRELVRELRFHAEESAHKIHQKSLKTST